MECEKWIVDTDGEGKATLHPGARMAHSPQIPQKGVLAQVCQGSSILAESTFHGEKALSSGYPELHGYVKPYSPACG
jgi:hypothetical protein